MEAARPAELADLERVATLLDAAVHERRGARGEAVASRLGPPHQIGPDALTDPASCVLVGTYDGVVFGLAYASLVATLDGGAIAELHDLYVEPDARGVGIGDMLMRSVIQWATDRGCSGVDGSVLPGDRDGKNFFERFGLVARAIRVHRELSPPSDAGGAA